MYSYITSQMTWSFSRISAFYECPYRFFLRYIALCEGVPGFFASFGSFIHRLLQLYLSGEISRSQAVQRYILGFRDEVPMTAPSPQIFSSYYISGLEYLHGLERPSGTILGIEEEFQFEIEGFPFVGFADLVMRDGDSIAIVDHKSRALKPRSGRSKPTKGDAELDSYLTQLYLYANPVRTKYGAFPDALIFNCYRTGTVISEPFCAEAYERSKAWAVDGIRQILSAQSWRPNVDYFRCRHLCDVAQDCDYYQLWEGGRN